MARTLFLMLVAAHLILILAVSVSAQVDNFAIAYGDTAADGVPAPGAGNLESGGAQDVYTFAGSSGDVIILDVISGYAGDFRWSLAAPDGTVLFDRLYVDSQQTLTAAGMYTITVYALNPTFTGTYSFRLLLAPPPQIFSVTIGDTIAENIPAPGAGNLETVGSLDVYHFDGAAGEAVLLDVIIGSAGVFRWELEAPDSTSLFDAGYLDRQVTLPQTGTYTLTIYGYALTSVGVYSFQLVQVSAPQQFTIAIGDTVSDGVPTAGAGNLEAAGSMDFYRFDAAAGQEIVLDALIGDPGTFLWKLDTPDGTELFDDLYTDHQLILPQTGTYTLTVRGYLYTSVGVYSFRLIGVPAPQYFMISIGDTVSVDAPAAGAGNLESPGALDVYSFNGAAGQDVLFDVLSNSATFGWRLQAPDSTILFDHLYNDSQLSLPQTGTYILTVYGIETDGTGSYSFSVLPAPATATPTATSTASGTATATSTATATPTSTETATASATATATDTATMTPTSSETATASATATATMTPTSTETATATATSSATATATDTATMTPTATSSETATASATATMTLTATSSETATASATATMTPTATSSETATAAGTATVQLSSTPAASTPTPTYTPVSMLPPPPPVPLCAGANYDAQGVVRVSLPDTLRHAVHCGVLYQNGQAVTWQGQTLYSEATLGAAGLLELGVQQAIDIFSPTGVTYFDGGAVFCLRGSGTLIWLAASDAPRHAEIIGSYTVPEFSGFTCVTLFEPGTLILVSENPIGE